MDKNERALGNRGERRCAQTREILPNSDLIRFVASEDGQVYPDVAAKAPGRGVWITASQDILEKAIIQNAFAKSLKQKANPNSELLSQTLNQLINRCLDLIGIGKRSGQLISGYDKVVAELKNKEPAFIIEASDSSEDGREKILKLAQKWPDIKIIGCFNSAQLSQKTGRENFVHGLINKGDFAKKLELELSRLSGFCEIMPNEWKI